MGFTENMEMREKRVSECEDISIEVIQYEEEREKSLKNINRITDN